MLSHHEQVLQEQTDRHNELHTAAKNHDYSKVNYLLNSDIDVNKVNELGQTALHVVQSINLSIIKLLLLHHADPFIRDNNGFSALGDWKQSDYLTRVENILLEYIYGISEYINKGPDKKIQTANNRLHRAVEAQDENLISQLIEQGYDINAEDQSGNLPIQYVGNYNIKLFTLLFASGSVLTMKSNKDKENYISTSNESQRRIESIFISFFRKFFSTKFENKKNLEIYRANKINFSSRFFWATDERDAEDLFKDTIYALLNKLQFLEVKQRLGKVNGTIELSLDLFYKNRRLYQEKTALVELMHLAIQHKNLGTLRAILALNHQVKNFVNFCDTYDCLNSPLQNAVRVGSETMVLELLESGADIDYRNANGETALHLAKTKEIIDLLIDYRADFTLIDKNKATCFAALGKSNFNKRLDWIISRVMQNLKNPVEPKYKDIDANELSHIWYEENIKRHGIDKDGTFELSNQLSANKKAKIYRYMAEVQFVDGMTHKNVEIAESLLKKITDDANLYHQSQYDLYSMIMAKTIDYYDSLSDRATDLRTAFHCLMQAADKCLVATALVNRKFPTLMAKSSDAQLDELTHHANLQWIAELKTLTPQSKHYSDAQYQLHIYYYRYYLTRTDVLKTQEVIDSIKKCFKYLNLAEQAGHSYAQKPNRDKLLASNSSITPGELSIQQAADLEITAKLLEKQENDKDYLSAQMILFEIYYYSRRAYTVYSHFNQRWQDIYTALQHLIIAKKNQPEFRHEFLDQYPDLLSGNEKNIQAIAYIIQLDELLDNEKPVTQAYLYSRQMAEYFADHALAFILYKKTNMFEVMNQMVEACEAVLFSELINSDFKNELAEVGLNSFLFRLVKEYYDNESLAVTKFSCDFINDHYQISYDATNTYHSMRNTIIFIDNNENEIARLKISDNKLVMNGYGNEIQLHILNNVGITELDLSNHFAELVLNVDIATQQGVLISSDVGNLLLIGKINSKKNINLEVDGNFILHKTAELESNANISIKANDLSVVGKLNAGNKIVAHVKQSVALTHDSRLNAKNAIIITAIVLKDVRGKINSEDHLHLYARDAIYIHGGAEIIAKKHLIISAKKIMSKDKSLVYSHGDFKVDIIQNLVIDDKSEWGALGTLTLKCDTLQNYNLISSTNLAIQAQVFRIFKHAKVSVKNYLSITGGSLWNAGLIEYKQCNLSLNTACVHGLAYAADIWSLPKNINAILARPTIRGGNINIVCAAYFNIASYIAVKNFYLATIAEINVGVNTHIFNQKSRIISLDFGLDLPNLPKIIESLSQKLNLISDGNYKQLALEILTWENLAGTMTFARWVIRHIIPLISKPVDMTWGLLMFLVNSPQMFSACKNLFYQQRPVERRDVIPILQLIKGVANQAMFTHMQLDSIRLSDFGSLHISSLGVDDITPLALDLISLYGPSSYLDSVFDITGKIELTGSSTNRSIFSYDLSGEKLGLNISNTAIYAIRNNNIYANNLSEEARYLETHNRVIVNTLSIDADNATILGEGEIRDAKISAHESLNIDGKLQGSGVIQFEAKHLNLTENSNIDSQSTIMLKGQLSSANAHLHAKDLYVNDEGLDSDTVMALINETGKYSGITSDESLYINTQQAVNISQDITAHREIDITASEIHVDHAISLDNRVILDATHSDIVVNANIHSNDKVILVAEHAKVISNAAKIDSNNGNIISGNKGVVLNVKTHTETEKTTLRLWGQSLTHSLSVTVVDIASIKATNGDNIIISEEGGLTGSAAEIKASGSNYVSVRDSVILDAIKKPENSGKNFQDLLLHLYHNFFLTPKEAEFYYPQFSAGEDNIVVSTDGAVNLSHADIHGIHQTIIDAHSGVNLQKNKIISDEVYIHAQQGNVTNHAGMIKGSVYTQIAAENGNFINECEEKSYHGGYDVRKKWTPAQTLGGSGEGHDGVGILVVANGEVINDASNILAIGDTIISAKNGLTSHPRAHVYISGYDEDEGFLGFSSRESTTWDTQVQAAVIGSAQGRNILQSQAGDVNLTATQLLSRFGSDIYAKKVKLFDIVKVHETTTSRSSYWGLSHDNVQEHYESSLPTVIANFDKGITRIHAISEDGVLGDIDSRGTFFKMPGEAEFLGKNIHIGDSKLNNYIKTEHSGFSVSVLGLKIFGSDPMGPSALLSPDPTLAHVQQLSQSSNAIEFMVNGASTSINAMNTFNTFSDALQSDQLLGAIAGRYGLSSLTHPTVSLTYTKSQSELKYETLAPGGIDTDKLTMQAEDSIKIEGAPVDVSGDMIVKAKSFTLAGVKLHDSMATSQTSISLSRNISGYAVGVSDSRGDMSESKYATQKMHVGGTLNMEVNQFTIDASQVDVGALAGNINHIDVITRADKMESKAENASVSTSGNIAFNKDSTKTATINNSSYLHIQNGLTNAVNIHHVDLTSADLTDAAKLAQGVVNHHQTVTYDKQDHHGMSASFAETKQFVDNMSKHIDTTKLTALKNITHEETLAGAKEKVHQALILSDEVYRKDFGAEELEQKGITVADSYVDPTTGTAVVVYVDKLNHEAYIAFRGSADWNSVTTDDVNIFNGVNPSSIDNPAFQNFFQAQNNKYTAAGYDIFLTGHSRGATQASIASSEYHLPAIVFDNPGSSAQQNSDMSQVISFQSLPNLVNSFPALTGRSYDYGTTINLPSTLSDQLRDIGAQIINKSMPALNVITLPGLTLFSHKLGPLRDRVEKWESGRLNSMSKS